MEAFAGVRLLGDSLPLSGPRLEPARAAVGREVLARLEVLACREVLARLEVLARREVLARLEVLARREVLARGTELALALPALAPFADDLEARLVCAFAPAPFAEDLEARLVCAFAPAPFAEDLEPRLACVLEPVGRPRALVGDFLLLVSREFAERSATTLLRLVAPSFALLRLPRFAAGLIVAHQGGV